MAHNADTKARFYAGTLDKATHEAAQARMTADGIGKAILVRRAVAAYLGLPEPVVRMGRPWPKQ